MTAALTDVLPTYLRLRETQRALNRALMKTLSKKAIETSARQLGMFEDGTIVADAQTDMDLVMDTAIYDYYPSGNKNAVARFASQHAVEGDEKLVLDAMLLSRFTLVRLGESTPGLGVQARDLVFEEDLFLADVSLSQTAVAGLSLATRLLTFQSFAMTTGAHLVVDDGIASLVGTGRNGFAGRSKSLRPRESTFLARLFLKLAMMDPEHARRSLADMAVAQLPDGDPRREEYWRMRAEQMAEDQ